MDGEIDNASEEESAGRLRFVAFAVGGLLLIGAAGFFLHSFLRSSVQEGPRVHQIALIKQPPPPPPPKPPEKPPDPPKVKEEVKIDQPKPEPKPEVAKAPDEKPASDKPLGVDAAGAGAGDSFGLVGSKGGRDLLSTGNGGSGAYYSGLLQRQFFEALSRNRKVLQDQFRVVVKIWLADDGHVTKADIVNGSGDAAVDEQIRITLLDMPPLRDVPPSSMRPMELRLSNRT
jgi:protein TonB